MTERFFITGATGFVGACLARRLVELGHTPHIIARGSSDMWRLADIKDKLAVHAGDVTDAGGLAGIVKEVKPTVVYHLAAHGAYPSQTDATRIMTVNVMGTLNLLQALDGMKETLVVNTGSSSEYGFRSTPMRETDVLAPNSFYAVAKANQTMLCQYIAAAQQRPIVTFRLFSVYGPYEEPTRLVPTLVRSCLQGKDLDMVAPETARDFIFVDDVVEAYLKVEQLRKAGGEIFNIASGAQVMIKQIADEAIALTGAKMQLHWGRMPGRSWDASTWVGDARKAKEQLGFAARTSLRDGLSKTIAWAKRHG